MEPEKVGIDRQYVSNDLSFTAFLLLRGAKLITAKKLGALFTFTLQLNGESARILHLEYINSEFPKFDSQIKELKKVMFSGS
jgi:hypothetical protein